VAQDYLVGCLECLMESLAELVPVVMEFKGSLEGLVEVSRELVTKVVVVSSTVWWAVM
jgi:hypothetical protein